MGFRALLIKTLAFLSMAVAAGLSITLLSHVFIPLVFTALVILIIITNKLLNRRLWGYLGNEVARVGDYVIYERGVYIRPLDALYLWDDVVRVVDDSSGVTLVFSDGSSLTLPRGFVEGFLHSKR